jgi:AtzE family amidohydrolase
MSLDELSASDIVAALGSRQVSAVEIAKAAIGRIEARDGAIRAFTDRTFDRALRHAADIDQKIHGGIDPGPLAGVPFAVKNLFDIDGVVTRAGSKIEREKAPARHDAALVERWTAAGGVLMGALNMDEYAYGFVTENAHDGPTHNPHHLDHMAGGSSGGSAAAVAAGMVPIAAGSDTNGSIRVPAAFCGVFGLKPTYGRLSRRGAFPFVNSLDHVGPFARTVGDLACAYNAAQGFDPGDPVQSHRANEPIRMDALPSASGLRIGLLDGWFADGASPDALHAVSLVAQALGAQRPISLPQAALARAAAFCMSAAEGASQHLENLKTRPGDFDPATRDRLLAGALLPASLVLRAQRFRAWFRAQVAEIFKDVDILLSATTPTAAPLIGQTTMTLDGQEILVRPNIGLYTQPISFIGLPALSVPVQRDGGLPLGVQVIAAPWREDLLFAIAASLEKMGIVSAPIAKAGRAKAGV